MNASALARKLKMTTTELLEKLPQMGFDIGARAIKIDDRLVDKIIKAFEDEKRKKQQLESQSRIKEIKLDKEKPLVEKKVKLPEPIIVRELADRLGVPLVKVMAELMKNGVIVSLNEKIDYETAAIISEDLGYQVEKQSAEEKESESEASESQQLKELLSQDKDNLQPKPPVVVVMGHVDHGKTKLLDAIRKTNVMDQESGGITQHIGAYQVTLPPVGAASSRGEGAEGSSRKNNEILRSAQNNRASKGRTITFIDTPGHEAFKSMRSRGSRVADLAIVVVAADEGLKPQTIEVFELVQREKLPFIVAINKIDKEGADIERVKKELAEINVVPEEWGGKTICVPISAKQGKGITELLDMVLLLADLSNFQASPDRPAIGTIIESHIDKGEGPVATVLISAGTLKTGDFVETGKVFGKIRVMKDFQGKNVNEAPPSMPVKILGLKCVPAVGDVLKVISDKRLLKQKMRECRLIKVKPLPTSKKTEEEKEQEVGYPIILKTDVLGSQGAIIESLAKISKPGITIKIIKKGLGAINEVDIEEAFAAKAVIIGFHVKVLPTVEKLAKEKNVEIKLYEVIYKLLEDLEEKLIKLTKPEIIREELGKIKILKIFRKTKNEQIVGGKVMVGKVINNTKVKIIRNDEIIGFNPLVINSDFSKIILVLKSDFIGYFFNTSICR